MMITKKPNAPLADILSFVEGKSQRHGKRDRAIYATRQNLRLCDMSQATVASVVDRDGSIRRIVIGLGVSGFPDNKVFQLTDQTQAEIRQYLQQRFGLDDLADLTPDQLNSALFQTQKTKTGFTSNTLGQHVSGLDKVIGRSFKAMRA